jgi:hypothetical protein
MPRLEISRESVSSRGSLRLTKRGQHLPANYDDIGGNPQFYPTSANDGDRDKFCTTMDYKTRGTARSRSASRERYSDSQTRKYEDDVRISDLEEMKSQTVKLRKKAEVDNLVESCRIKNSMLKEKLRSAETKLRELMSNQAIQREIQAKSDSIMHDSRLWKDYKHVRKIASTFVQKPSSVAEEQKLAKLKEDRAVQNHNLNLVKNKIDRLRKTEGQLLRQSKHLAKEERSLYGKLTHYQDFARENLELKSRIKRASAVLN